MTPKDVTRAGAASTYDALIEAVFLKNYKSGAETVAFSRPEFEALARQLKIQLPKNLGDVIYSYRFRKPLPKRVRDTAGENEEWVIEGRGSAKYVFKRVPASRIEPQPGLYAIKIPEATPEIVSKYALSDEQALLAKVRYNRLIDLFLSVNAYSLQSHLRTQVKGVGQIEVDELYVGVKKSGAQVIIPVQAKGGRDKIGVVQIQQDIAFCIERFPDLICRSVAAQFMDKDIIAMFELAVAEGRVQIVEERHYRLVAKDQISPEDLRTMAREEMDRK